MESKSSTTSQELIDRAGQIFRERHEPKFPSVREKLLSGIVRPDAQVFLSSFDHLNPNTFYAKNELLALDQEPILRAFSLSVREALQATDLTAKDRGTYEVQMIDRLGAMLGLYDLAVNEAGRRGLPGSAAIQELRKMMEHSLRLDTRWIKEVLQSSMMQNISDALEEITTQFRLVMLPLREKNRARF